jgi:hypothetical protein
VTARKLPKSSLRASQHALGGLGWRPNPRLRMRRQGTVGFSGHQVNEAINALIGHAWVIEDDCISFDAGALMWSGGHFRVVQWDGTVFRGAATPAAALWAYRRGMTRPDNVGKMRRLPANYNPIRVPNLAAGGDNK